MTGQVPHFVLASRSSWQTCLGQAEDPLVNLDLVGQFLAVDC